MTVQTNTNVASFNGNGVTQIFPIAFKFNNDTNLVVLLIDDATGSVSQLTLNSDYTVSGEGDEEGGLINVVVAPATGKRLKVTRVVDILQLTDLRNQGKFFPEIHEDALDLLTMIAQQQESDIKSALRVAESDPEPARIPPVAERANKILSFDEDGNPQVVAPVTDSATELRQDLITSAGSGLVGFDPDETYPVDTVGAELKAQGAQLAAIAIGIPGAVGDGVADDTAAIVAKVTASSGVVTFEQGKTYKITDRILVDHPVIIDLNGATIQAELTTTVPAFDVQSNHVRICNGSISVNGTTMGGYGGSLNCIYAGNQATGAGWHNLRFHGLTVTTNRSDAGAHIGIIGECHNVVIENIKVPDNAVCRNIIGIEWGGTPGGGTGHPHNITVRNLEIGRITTATYGSAGYAYAVWISAAFDIRVENITMIEGYGLVMATRGDNANTYAPLKYKHLVGRGITVDNASLAECFGYGVRAIGSHRSGALDNIPMSVIFRNIKVGGKKVGANNNFGFAVEQSDGVILEDFEFTGTFAAGITTGTNNDNLAIRDGKVSGSELYGASIGNSARWASIQRVKFSGNNTLGGAGATTAALVFGDALHPVIDDCVFGMPGEVETQKYSIYCQTSTVSPKLNGNHTYALAASGAAYVMGASTNYEINATGANNTAEAGLLAFGGAPIFSIDNMGFRTFTTSTAVGTVPTTGTWTRGDRLYYGQPSASSYIGAVCVASGTPGTWRSFGAIIA